MRNLLAGLVLVLLVGGALAYNRLTARRIEESGRVAAAIPEPAAVSVATARPRRLEETITVVGTLRADDQAAVTAPIPARVRAVLVREGDRVAAGAPVLRLDLAAGAARVEGASAAEAAAMAQRDKAVEALRARRVEMDSKVAEAEGAVQAARSRVRQAELGLELTVRAAAGDAEKAQAGMRQAEAALAQAESGLRQARRGLERVQFLHSRGGAPRADLEAAQAAMDTARAQRDEAAAALDQARAAALPARDSAALRRDVAESEVQAARAGLAAAESGLRNARKARQAALEIAHRDVQAAEAQLRQASAGRSEARAQVGSEILTSPIEGIASEVSIHAGETAQPGQPLVTVVATDQVYLDGTAPARFGPRLRIGQGAMLRIDALPGAPLPATVIRLLPTAGQGGAVVVHLRPRKGSAALRPGVPARAELRLSHGHVAVAVPAAAVRHDGAEEYVLVVREGRAARRTVILGAESGGIVEVRSGLDAGDQVIVAAPTTLRPGDPVRAADRLSGGASGLLPCG